MPNNFFNSYLLPIAVFSASIMGVGFFALPYVAMKSGIWLMLAYFIVLVCVVSAVHIIFAEVSLNTPDFKRFPGFVKFHFGKTIGFFYIFSTVFGYFGVLLIYLIAGSGFLSNVFSFGENQSMWAFVFWVPICLLIFLGIKIICKAELAVVGAIIFTMAVIFISGFFNIKAENIFILNLTFSIRDLFLPYGAIIFSLWGIGMIPEIEEMLGENKKNLKKVVMSSIVLVATIYLFFIFLILGITGSKTTEIALVGLKDFLNPWVYSLALFLGVITTFSGSVMLGLTLKKVFIYDLGIKKIHAWVYVCFLPMILFLVGFRSFLGMVSLIGGILLGIDGIFVLLMYKKIGGKKAIVFPLFIIFLAGIAYQIFYFTN